ncbi:hypothetical protein ACLBX9_06845 [Methylobacterium sp. A49B]
MTRIRRRSLTGLAALGKPLIRNAFGLAIAAKKAETGPSARRCLADLGGRLRVVAGEG